MLALAFFLAGLIGTASQESPSELNDQLSRGQEAIYRLDFEEAERIARDMRLSHPEAPHGHALASFVSWNRLLHAAGNLATDDYATPSPLTGGKPKKPIQEPSRQFHRDNQELIAVCERLVEDDPENTVALYFLGVAYENLAAEAIAVTKSTGDAMKHEREANRYHTRVLKLDPEFVDAKLSIATAEFAAASLHWSLRWIAWLFFHRGNKEEALAKLEEVRNQGTYRSLDASTVLALLNAWKGDPQRAVEIFSEIGTRFPSNYLIDINIAAIYEVVLGQPLQALEVYEKLLADLPNKAPGLQKGEVLYRIGKTRYQLREYSQALEAFHKALESPRGEIETEALSEYYIARIHEEQGERQLAAEFYRKVLDYPGDPSTLRAELREAKKKSRSQ